jgi:hypothetical protein
MEELLKPRQFTAEMEKLAYYVAQLPVEFKRITPFCAAGWELSPEEMIALVDAGVLGMDGFRYAFVEYARDAWERCHR